MATARCERFPTGEAHIRTTAGIVTFIDGAAVVESPELVEALREVPDVFGISVVGAETRGSAPSRTPRNRTTKAKE